MKRLRMIALGITLAIIGPLFVSQAAAQAAGPVPTDPNGLFVSLSWNYNAYTGAVNTTCYEYDSAGVATTCPSGQYGTYSLNAKRSGVVYTPGANDASNTRIYGVAYYSASLNNPAAKGYAQNWLGKKVLPLKQTMCIGATRRTLTRCYHVTAYYGNMNLQVPSMVTTTPDAPLG